MVMQNAAFCISYVRDEASYLLMTVTPYLYLQFVPKHTLFQKLMCHVFIMKAALKKGALFKYFIICEWLKEIK